MNAIEKKIQEASNPNCEEFFRARDMHAPDCPWEFKDVAEKALRGEGMEGR